MFDLTEQRLVRNRLAEVLRFVIAQRLLPRAGGGRVAAIEIMGQSLRVRDLIREGRAPKRPFTRRSPKGAPRAGSPSTSTSSDSSSAASSERRRPSPMLRIARRSREASTVCVLLAAKRPRN